MNKTQLQVKEFHKIFGCVISDKPTLPDAETLQLRLSLIAEEFKELQHALGFTEGANCPWRPLDGQGASLEEAAKELGDLLYVAYGTAIALGLDMEPIMDEIHRSNVSKVDPDGTVHRRHDGKILKPKDYSPADLKEIIKQQSR